MKNQEFLISGLVAKIQASRKYRSLQIPFETIASLISNISPEENDPKTIRKVVREKLHHIVAAYLGDPDYGDASAELKCALESQQPDAIRDFCLQMLSSHASTRERIPVLSEFYNAIFSVTGKPKSILDLACGLNPFAFPWMGLSNSVDYRAFDIHLPRISLLNQFFAGLHLSATAIHQDILVHPPRIKADVAFLFKEAHRMEQRQPGCSAKFWQDLNVRWLVITLPSYSLTGRHNLSIKHHKLIMDAIAGSPWAVTEFIIQGEMVFCMKKPEYGKGQTPS